MYIYVYIYVYIYRYVADTFRIVILLYKDDIIFISLFIVYFLAVYHAMVYPLALNILGTLLSKIYIYHHQSFWKLKLKRTKQTEWVERIGQLPD